MVNNTTKQAIFKKTNAVVVGGAIVAGGTLLDDHFETLGTFVCNGATPVTVTDPNVTANSSIVVTLKTVGGTVSPSVPYIATITAGTGFTITGTASDTSTYNYRIIG
jgi:hypothetical protein